MSMTKQQQVAYVANIAFADALGSAADDMHTEDVDSKRIYDKLQQGPMAVGCELTSAALEYQMQQQFVDYARNLLAKVEDSPHWNFLMAVATDKGQREALYLLYMKAVGHGVGFGDHEWPHIIGDVVDAPADDLKTWSKHFTCGNVLNVRGKPYTGETPMVNWPLRDARPMRKAP
jgi:hypothetical protein